MIASFEVIGIEEVGVLFNTYTQSVENRPYNHGRYLIGLGKKFIRYPRNL